MNSYSDVLKQDYNSTETYLHLEPIISEKIFLKPKMKTVSKMVEYEDYKEKAWEYSIDYYGGTTTAEIMKKVEKPRKIVAGPDRSRPKHKVSPREILTDGQEFHVSQKGSKKRSQRVKVTKVKPAFQYFNTEQYHGDKFWIYAHDYSGSTDDAKTFFQKTQKYLDDFKKNSANVENVLYLIWNDDCYESNFVFMDNFNVKKIASEKGDKNLTAIPEWILKNGLQNKTITLWLISDGEIDRAAVLACKSLNSKINFKSMTLVTINEKKINSSVSLAFLNPGCKKITIIEETGNIQKKICIKDRRYDFGELIYSNFLRKYDNLLNFVIIKFSIDFNEMDISDEEKREFINDKRLFVNNLETKKKDMIETYRTIQSCNNEDANKNVMTSDIIITKKFDAIIHFIHNTKNYSMSFTQLKSQIKRFKLDDTSLPVGKVL